MEKTLHTAFAPNRVNHKREFFSINAQQAIAILKLLHVDDATQEIEAMANADLQEDVQAANLYKARRPNLNFREMGIPFGATLNLIGSDASVLVAGDKKVLLNGEEISLTAATRALRNLPYNVAPIPHWTFEGKMLLEIYDETYSGED